MKKEKKIKPSKQRAEKYETKVKLKTTFENAISVLMKPKNKNSNKE